MNYVRIIREHFKDRPVFSISDIRIFLAKKGISKGYSNLLVHNLLKKGELHKIAKGIYSFRDDASVAGFAFAPFYYGLQEALSLRNLWEQETNPVVITPKKVRTGLRKIMDANVVVRHISRKMFFGFDMVKYYDIWLPVSDVEKTLIDFVYFREYLPGEALKEIRSRIEIKKLRQYLKRCPQSVKRRLVKLIGKW